VAFFAAFVAKPQASKKKAQLGCWRRCSNRWGGVKSARVAGWLGGWGLD